MSELRLRIYGGSSPANPSDEPAGELLLDWPVRPGVAGQQECAHMSDQEVLELAATAAEIGKAKVVP